MMLAVARMVTTRLPLTRRLLLASLEGRAIVDYCSGIQLVLCKKVVTFLQLGSTLLP